MRKIYCDRCGKELSEAVGEDVMLYIHNLASVHKCNIRKEAHLCEDCFKEFIDDFLYSMDKTKEDSSY